MIGSHLSHFRVTAKLGEGGMGEVYRAEDTQLGREVAIKVLPEALAEDRDRLARFEREAQVLASLNHPNIAAIYGLEQAGDRRCLVLELVEGPTLADRLAAGPVATTEALEIAHQIAQALEAAHERSIVHRDLKPANIKITPEGKVKVLDFGLAKALDESPADAAAVTQSPTLTLAATQAGIILGTAAYMSPEQAAGKPLDRRADIWAFGVVLHEMLCGKALFAGDTVSETLAGVIMKEPDWEALPAKTPRVVRWLLERCLRKDPRSRLRDIGDARIVLEEALAGDATEEVDEETRAPRVSGRQKLLGVAAALGALGLGLLLGRFGASTESVEPTLRKFAITVPGSQTSSTVAPVISPDGRWIVYGKDNRLWLRDLTRYEPRELADTEKGHFPFWSPDSQWIGFAQADKLLKAPASGGTPTVICTVSSEITSGGGAVWGEDGRIVFTTGSSGLLSVSAQGGDPTPFLEPGEDELDFHEVGLLPEGKGYLFVLHDGGGYDTIAWTSGGERKVLLELEGMSLDGPAYSPTGHILFERSPVNSGIWAVPFSLSKLEVTGEPFLVVAGSTRPSVSHSGDLVYVQGTLGRLAQLALVSRDGVPVQLIGEPATLAPFPSLSPDGRRAAVALVTGETREIWIYDLDRQTRARITSGEGQKWVPIWSPDGERIYYSTFLGGRSEIRSTKADGSTSPELVLAEESWSGAWGVSSDGRTLLLERGASGDTERDIWILELGNEEGPKLFLQTPARETWARTSPDGRFVVYQSNESGRDEIYLQRFPEGGSKWLVSTGGGTWPTWSRNGREIVYVQGAEVMAVDVELGPSVRLGTPEKLFTRSLSGTVLPFEWPEGFDVSADGERFLVLQNASEETASRSIAVVQNWFAEFREDS